MLSLGQHLFTVQKKGKVVAASKVFTISAIFSAGVLQSSEDEPLFCGLLVLSAFPRRCEVTALASLRFTAASSAVL